MCINQNNTQLIENTTQHTGDYREKRVSYMWKSDKRDALTDCLLDEQGSSDYQMFLNAVTMNNDVDEVTYSFQNYITCAVDKVLLKSKTRSNNKCFPQNGWYDEECKKMKSDLHKLDTNTSNNLNNYFSLKQQYKRLLQRKKRAYKMKTIDKIIATNPHYMWNILKENSKPSDRHVPVDSSLFFVM